MNSHSSYYRVCLFILLALVLSVSPGLLQPSLAASGMVSPHSKEGISNPFSIPSMDFYSPSATNEYMGSGWYSDIIDHSGNTGAFNSTAFDPRDGSFWISYFDVMNSRLMLAHFLGKPTGNCGPGNTWDCYFEYTSMGGELLSTSMDIYYNDNEKIWILGVSFYNAIGNCLEYLELYTINGTSTYHLKMVDQESLGDEVGKYSSLKFDAGGVAHIAYQVKLFSGKKGLKYAHFVDVGNGNCGTDHAWQCDEIDMSTVNDPGGYPSLDFAVSSIPAVAYYDSVLRDLKYAYLSNPLGDANGNCGPQTPQGYTWTCRTVDSDGDVGRFASLHAIDVLNNDHMQIAYYGATLGQLKYTSQVGQGGNCGYLSQWSCQVVDSDIGIFPDGYRLGIALGVKPDFSPVIAYMDGGIDTAPISLNIAYPHFGGNCGRQGMVNFWQCTIIDPGRTDFNEAAFVSLATKPTGGIMIAYTETNTLDYPVTNQLEVAYQHWYNYLPITKK